jgi:hypothetical protein
MLLFLYCSLFDDTTSNISNAVRVQVFYCSECVHSKKGIYFEINKNPDFLKLTRSNYIASDSCKYDGKIWYLDSAKILIEGMFSLERHSLFLSEKGKLRTYFFNQKSINALIDSCPSKKREVIPHGNLGIMSKGEKYTKEDLCPGNFGTCSFKMYGEKSSIHPDDNLGRSMYRYTITDEKRNLILKGIDSIGFIKSWNHLKDDSSQISLEIVFDNKRVHFPFNSPLTIAFFETNFNVGFSWFNIIYFDSSASQLIKSTRNKLLVGNQ